MYGYAPFCDTNEEMADYRFWEKGFWKDHLQSKGMSYHISCTYLINLKEFRKQYAGTILRTACGTL